MKIQVTTPSTVSIENLSDYEFVSTQDFVERLHNVPLRAQFVTFISETTPRMRKTDNPYWDSEKREWNIVKRSRVNGMINFIYENSVNNQREREQEDPEDFESRERSWGSHVDETPLVEHKGNYYLHVKVEDSLETKYIDSNGSEVDREEIEEFLYSSGESSRQGVKDKVIVRDYKIQSIKRISVDGKKFKLNN